MAIDLQTADAVTDAINTASLGMPVVATRYYVPNFDLRDMTQLRVSVVPRGLTITPVARKLLAYDPHIDVAVQKKFTTGDAAEIDPLRHLVEEIDDLFRLKRLAGFPEAGWIKTEYRAIYSAEHFQELKTFTSVLTLTFRVMR